MFAATFRGCCATVSLTALLLITAKVQADSIQLANGDILNGRILGVDDKQVRLQSDVHGQLTIPRAKVVAITFGDRKAPAAVPAPAPAAPAAGTAMNLDDVLKQLKAGGVNQGTMGDLQKLLPLLANPQVSQYFGSKVQGLQSGKLSVQDIRRDAIRARDQAKELTKGMGADVEAALAPYLNILDQFIRETDPAKAPGQQPGKQAEKK